MTTIAKDREFLRLMDAHGGAAVDARALGGDLGSAHAYGAAEEAVIAFLDDRTARMASALEEIKRAAQSEPSPGVALLAIADLAEAGLRVT